MAQLIYGINQQIQFQTESDFYETLGFLAKNDGSTSIHWEHNEIYGAWGSEGRIHCYRNLENFPVTLRNAFTAGVGNVLRRINCNEFIACILRFHNFTIGEHQNQQNIQTTIPQAFIDDYNRGLTL